MNDVKEGEDPQKGTLKIELGRRRGGTGLCIMIGREKPRVYVGRTKVETYRLQFRSKCLFTEL